MLIITVAVLKNQYLHHSLQIFHIKNYSTVDIFLNNSFRTLISSSENIIILCLPHSENAIKLN